jgi:hypothetical protein
MALKINSSCTWIEAELGGRSDERLPLPRLPGLRAVVLVLGDAEAGQVREDLLAGPEVDLSRDHVPEVAVRARRVDDPVAGQRDRQAVGCISAGCGDRQILPVGSML